MSIALMPKDSARAQAKEHQRLKDIGERVAHARRLLSVTRKADISASALARMAGLPPSTVIRIEDGRADPEEATLAKLANVLGVTVAHLRYGIEPTPVVPLSAPSGGKKSDA